MKRQKLSDKNRRKLKKSYINVSQSHFLTFSSELLMLLLEKHVNLH